MTAKVPDKAPGELDLDELLDMWDKASELERYCVRHLGYKASHQNILGKLKRDLADHIARQSAINRLRES